ncbi:MAG: hypothetical protein JXB20_01255 [Bacilli bacterium]|nr:hypothetical protein [Bacilli bacterium]MBN2696616.1 hypothetical protein [Bacilli bacterium]
MKKFALLMIALFASLALFGCNNSEFKVDGEFTAYEVGVHNNAPMVTMVTVTIEKGKVVSYYIDARQGVRTQTAGTDTPEDTSDDTYSFAWNAETKKELGDDYGMVARGGAIAEWYVQAERIEEYWLENGHDSVTVNEEDVIDNVTGVTIKDGGYIALAAEALELAKQGKFQAILCSETNLYSAHMIVNEKGEITELQLDTLQKARGTAADVFAWNTSTKQALGFNYKMHYNTYVGTLADAGTATMEGYEAWLTANNKLEWFQQVDTITDYILENGWQDSYATAGIDSLTAVTVSTDEYYEVLDLLFDTVAEGELD